MQWLIIGDPEDGAALQGRLELACRRLADVGFEASLQTEPGESGAAARYWFRAPREPGAAGLAKAVADTVIHDIEPEWLLRRLKKEKPEFPPEDAAHVVSLALYEVRSLSTQGSSERNAVFDRLAAYLVAERRLHIRGFLRFRLRGYWEELADCLARAIKDFEADREHKEFVRLLRQFVEDQAPRVRLVHVVQDTRGSFRLLDAAGEAIERPSLDGFALELALEEVDREELLISSLVSLAPVEVRCHLPRNAWNLVEVEEVFAGRFHYCGGCDLCHPNPFASVPRRRP